MQKLNLNKHKENLNTTKKSNFKVWETINTIGNKILNVLNNSNYKATLLLFVALQSSSCGTGRWSVDQPTQKEIEKHIKVHSKEMNSNKPLKAYLKNNKNRLPPWNKAELKKYLDSQNHLRSEHEIRHFLHSKGEVCPYLEIRYVDVLSHEYRDYMNTISKERGKKPDARATTAWTIVVLLFSLPVMAIL